MKVSQTSNEIIIKENPGCLWLVGLFFAGIGGILIYGALGGFYNYRFQAPWVLAITLLMGIGAVIIGIWTIYTAPITKIFIDRLENQVNITRIGIFGKKETAYSFDEIERFCLIEEIDNEGSLCWYFGLKLVDGEQIKMTAIGSYAEDYEQKYVFGVNEFIGKQPTVCELIFANQDTNLEEQD